MAIRLRHITVESGHEAVTARADVGAEIIDLLAPLVSQAIDTGARVEVPGGYWMQCQLRDGGLAVGIGHEAGGDAILVGMDVQPADGADLPVLRVSMAIQLAGEIAGRLYEVAAEIGDLERCIAWTWLETQGETQGERQ